jgi:hypothetical protein
MNKDERRKRHSISREEAVLLVRRRPAKISGRGGHLPRHILDELLAQPGCEGVRFYFGTKPDGAMTMVFVGIDGNERDMTDGAIMQDFFPCPPFCDPTSLLVQ